MIEILGTPMTDGMVIGDACGAVVGAVIISFVLYVVAKIKHSTDILDAENAAKLAGEAYPEYKVKKANVWYKGYKLGMISCFLLALGVGFGTGVLGVHLGWTDGAIEVGALGAVAALAGGLLLDRYMVHPIADGKFVEKVETPLVDAFLNPAPETPDEGGEAALIELARRLKAEGKI